MTEKRRSIMKSIIHYSSSQYISQGLGFFTATFTRRFLGPFNMGIWQILTVILAYTNNVHLGTTDTVYYKTPLLKGEGRPQDAEKVKNTVFSFITTMSLVSSAAIVAYALCFHARLSSEIFWGLIAVSILLIVQRIYTFYITLLRANKEFLVLSKSIVFDSILGFLFVFTLVYNFKLYGLFFVVIVTPVLNVFFIRHYANYDLHYVFNFDGLFSYIKFGFPLFIQGWMLMVLNSIDKIMISKMLGLEALGFYSIALMVRGYGASLPKNFSMVISPHLLEDYGKAQDIKKVSHYVTVPSLINAYFMSFVLGLIFIASVPFVVLVLPKFIPGIPSMRMFLFAIFFTSLAPEASHSLVAMNKQTRLLPILGVVIAINVLFNYMLIKLGFGIVGSAMATALSSLVYFVLVFIYSMKHFERAHGILRFILSLFFPLAYAVLVLFILERTVHNGNMIVEAFVKSALFLAAFSPLVFYINRRTKVVNVLIDVVKGRFLRKK